MSKQIFQSSDKSNKNSVNSFKPLKFKESGLSLKDFEYLILIGEECERKEKNHTNDRIPVKYDFDQEVVSLSKDVLDKKRNGYTDYELIEYTKSCINMEQ